MPEGWKAIWNDQYKEWFYVNIHTKQSQWDRPTEPVYAPPADGAPSGAPPAYDVSTKPNLGSEKSGHLGSNNPYGSGASGSGSTNDENYAHKLQEEENARLQQHNSSGGNSSYYAGPPQSTAGQPYGMNQGASPAPMDQDRGKKGGLLGKIQSKLGGGSKPHYGQQGYGGGYPQQGYGGYPPQQGYGYPPQQGYGYPPQPGYGYPPPGGGMYGRPQRRPGGGMGMGGGMALGAGAGLLGGALIGSSMAGGQQDAYQEGFQDGNDFDGGDMDGGDMGGDF